MAAAQLMEEATFLTSELEFSVQELAQEVRRALRTAQQEVLAPEWLGTSAQLSSLWGGSLMFLSSPVDGATTLVIPPATPGAPLVRVLAGRRCVKVSRDGTAAGTKFIKIGDILSSLERGALGVVTMGDASGPRPKFPNKEGVSATLCVSRSATGCPQFTMCAADTGEVLSSGTDAAEVLRAGGVDNIVTQRASMLHASHSWGFAAVPVPLPPHVSLSDEAVASAEFQAFSKVMTAVGRTIDGGGHAYGLKW